MKNIITFILAIIIVTNGYNAIFSPKEEPECISIPESSIYEYEESIEEDNDVYDMTIYTYASEDYGSDYYYNMLSYSEQCVYNQLLDSILSYDSVGFVPEYEINYDQLIKIIDYLYCDKAYELWWWNHVCNYSYDGDIITKITPTYNELASSREELLANKAQFDLVVQDYMMEAAGMSDYDKCKYFHDRLKDEIVYENSSLDQTSFSALVNKRTVCSGYAEAYKMLLTRAGIRCYTCTGYTSDGRHQWNIVDLYGDPKNVDVTWDDTIDSDRYFMISDYDYSATRDRYGPLLPICY